MRAYTLMCYQAIKVRFAHNLLILAEYLTNQVIVITKLLTLVSSILGLT